MDEPLGKRKIQMEQTREQWLASLKPGDKVVRVAPFSKYVATIDRITPKRQFTVDGSTYNKRGVISIGGLTSIILPVTQEQIDADDSNKLRRQIADTCATATLPTLRNVQALLQEVKP